MLFFIVQKKMLDDFLRGFHKKKNTANNYNIKLDLDWLIRNRPVQHVIST